MTYRLFLWFDMLEEEGKSTERVRVLFANRSPLLSRDLSKGSGYGGCYLNGDGLGSGVINGGDGCGGGYNYGNGSGNGFYGFNRPKIIMVKI